MDHHIRPATTLVAIFQFLNPFGTLFTWSLDMLDICSNDTNDQHFPPFPDTDITDITDITGQDLEDDSPVPWSDL